MNFSANNNLRLRILAFLISLILWILAGNLSLPFLQENAYVTIKTDLPIHIKYDETKYKVGSINITKANLKLIGESLAYQFFVNYTLSVDLENKKAGYYTGIPIEAKNLPADIKYEVIPKTLNIELQERR